MALNQDATGRPPAVTAEMVARWQTLAEDFHAALDQGGERGMDLLLAIIPEWREAVEDINAAWRISVDMAMQGLRDEALHWHAEQFTETANSLTSERNGWKAWEAALIERGVSVPIVDSELKKNFEAIPQAMQLRDPSGAALGDWITRLRRNILARGPLDQRLVILQALQRLQPGDQIWEEMINPIRKQRAGVIGEEATTAITAQDFVRLAALREEVRGWDPRLLGGLAAVLDASLHWQRAWELRSNLKTALSDLASRVEALQSLPAGFPSHANALASAKQARDRFQQIAAAMRQAILSAEKVPAIRGQLVATGIVESYKKAESLAKEPYEYLAALEHEEGRQKKVFGREDQIQAHLDRVPRAGSFEVLKKEIPVWLSDLEELRRSLKRALDTAGFAASPSVQELLDRAGVVEQDARQRLQRIIFLERLLIGAVVTVILVAVLAAFVVIILGQ